MDAHRVWVISEHQIRRILNAFSARCCYIVNYNYIVNLLSTKNRIDFIQQV